MRLGLRPTIFSEDSQSWSAIRKLYGGASKIWERHRHRYEVNPKLVDRIETKGMAFVGKDEKDVRMQVLELKGLFFVSMEFFKSIDQNLLDHPYFVGMQAHPEFCSRPLNPSPPFLGLVAAASGLSKLQEQLISQEKSYVPPHPEHAMVEETIIRDQQPSLHGAEVIINGVNGR